jgi:hypothetical protein
MPTREPSTGEPKDYREERVRRALARDGRVQEPELTVDIRGDRVVVTGVVPTEARRRAIGRVVRDVCPDLEIDNQTSVGAYPEPASTERIE